MTVNEIFTHLTSHMVEGMMYHEQMANYYDFLNLKGYKRCHEYHYLMETLNHRKIQRYYINHYQKLIEDGEIRNPNGIPSNWYRHVRQDVDGTTKKNSVKAGIESWVSWEKHTKDLYSELYIELVNLGEISSASELECLICDVDEELKYASRKHLDLMSVDYNISDIILEQDRIHDKYKTKIHDFRLNF